MITVAEAVEIIQGHWPDFGEGLFSPSSEPFGIITQPAIADRDYPPIDRVMMDGIALNWSEYAQGRRQFSVLGTVAAGDRPVALTNTQGCLEIMTGAPLPQHCDLIIPYEDLVIENDVAQIIGDRQRHQFQFVHRRGSDTNQGQAIVTPPAELNGPLWNILCSFGQGNVKGQKKPWIEIISTGDELVKVEQIPEAYQLRRSNVSGLEASLRKRGLTSIKISHLPDDIAVITDHFQGATAMADILIYSGGISKGKFDYLPGVWQKMGVKKYFHGVAQRPGKPFYFGVHHQRNTAILGLPGNPISSLVCLHRYFFNNPVAYAQLQEEVTFEPKLTYFLPVKAEFTPQAVLQAQPLPAKNSGEFVALAQSTGFIELPQHQSHFTAGECFPYYAW